MAREPQAIVELRRTLGSRLTTFRLAAGMTQGQLANMAFCDRTTVNHIEKGRARADVRFWRSVDEAVHADGALLAARKGDACHAWELLGEARMASRLLGSEYADIHTIFGPTNVAIYSVQVAAELGNGHDVIRRGKQVDVEHLPPSLRERRSQFLIDLAQGHVLLGSDDVATETLLRAENTAPEEIRFNLTAHRLVRIMLGRERLGATPGLRGLARRMDVER